MTGNVPAVFSIPAGISFLDALARTLLQRWGSDPVALSRALVLLPTRRGCRALQEALLRWSEGRPLLLPRLVPLGDLDADELLFVGDHEMPSGSLGTELAPSMAPLRRLLLLSRLVQEWGKSAEPDR